MKDIAYSFIIIKISITDLAFNSDKTEQTGLNRQTDRQTHTHTHTHTQSVSLPFVSSCILCAYLIILDTAVFPGGSVVNNPSANAGDSRNIDSLPGSWRSPEVGNGTYNSIVVWKIPWTVEPGGLQSMGVQSQTLMSMYHTHKPVKNRIPWLLSTRDQ